MVERYISINAIKENGNTSMWPSNMKLYITLSLFSDNIRDFILEIQNQLVIDSLADQYPKLFILTEKEQKTDYHYIPKENWEIMATSELLDLMKSMSETITNTNINENINKVIRIIENKIKVSVLNYNVFNPSSPITTDNRMIDNDFIKQWGLCSFSNRILQEGLITSQIDIYTYNGVFPQTIFPIQNNNDIIDKYAKEKLKGIY